MYECSDFPTLGENIYRSQTASQIFNHLPHHIKKLSNNFKLFKSKLKTFLLENTCYSIEEFFKYNRKQDKPFSLHYI